MPEKIISFTDLSHLTIRQWDATNATEQFRYVLYGGSMGAGKSYWLRWNCIYWLIKLAQEYKVPGIRAGLFCEDYGSLNDRHISKIKLEFPSALGSYNEQRHEFQLLPRYGGGILAFRNLDDPTKYLSSEFAIVAVDELVKDPKSVFDILRTRMRWVGINTTKFFAATNPGEGWVKQFFIDKNFPETEQEPNEFCYVSALPKDNPYLDKSYFASLESLPDAERKAYLEGDWTAFEKDMDDEGFYPLLSSSELANAFIEAPVHVGDCCLMVDPAAGGDNSAVVIQSKTCKEILLNQKTKDIMSLVPFLVDCLRSYERIKMIFIDKTGVGEGLVARMKELQRDLNVKVRGVSFAEATEDNKVYQNLKAELYFKERDWILKGGRLVRNDGWNEFTAIKYKRTSDGRIIMMGKDVMRKHGYKSPNVVDASVLGQLAPKDMSRGDIMKGRKITDVTERIWQGR
jgi:hypothetical protein